MNRGDWVNYTAYCMKNVPITIVNIWVSDGSFVSGLDNAEVPVCCHPPVEDKNPKVEYTFQLHCVSQCVTTGGSRRRRLVASDDVEIDEAKKAMSSANEPRADGASGHYCASEDFACGKNNDMVYVCHYSAKHGYQTYCVPEPDSDIVEFYPKDYCGQCVGGYVAV